MDFGDGCPKPQALSPTPLPTAQAKATREKERYKEGHTETEGEEKELRQEAASPRSVSTPACQVLLQVRAGRAAHRALACLFVYVLVTRGPHGGGASHRPDGHFLPARFSEPFPSDTYGKKREMTNETREGAKGGAEARPMSDVRARRRGAGAAGTGMAMPRERGVISPPLCALWCHLIGQRATRNGRSPLFLFVGKRGRGGGKGPITEQRAALIGAALSTPSATCREQPEANDISPAVGG